MNPPSIQELFHYSEPNYDSPELVISEEVREQMRGKLEFLYGNGQTQKVLEELLRIMRVYYAHKTDTMRAWETVFEPENRFTEEDVILITYGDLVKSPDERPLQTLAELCRKYLKGNFNILHILPFFPFSSDRGFSVMDFEQVDPNLGTWQDIIALKNDFKLMFDGVINHVSAKSRWFQEFLNQNPAYLDFFTVFSTKEQISPEHLKLIVRPRTSSVLTEFQTLDGPRLVWTTFSPDQIDLNYKNPNVLLKIAEILLLYVLRGADMIRLDAVTYLWDEMGTTSVHLEQTHICIKLFRIILDAVAPHVALITETNVPHEENIQYFGSGQDEAQMVYNFALPPLVLHTFQTKNCRKLMEWASSLEKISDTATYFNFLDSHDGIGVMGVKGILTEEEIEMMTLRVLEHGGYISYKDNGDGSVSPYEMNITWYSAINNEYDPDPRQLRIKRYLASRAIAFVLMGVPGIYLHGLLGSRNDTNSVLEQGQRRNINRKTISKKELLIALEDRNSNIFKIAQSLVRMVSVRRRQKCFHPNAGQEILDISDSVFAVKRTSVDHSECILTLTNISNTEIKLSIRKETCRFQNDEMTELLTKTSRHFKDGVLELVLNPYDILWLKPKRTDGQGK